MKALVFHDIGKINLEEVKEPKIEEKDDAIVRITTSAICGTDLHFVRGTVGPMKKGTILGHEAVGIIEENKQGQLFLGALKIAALYKAAKQSM